ncbi:hypothetical protein KM800_04190 [Clostridium tyrobutyricum]|uniref:hypothetical protein n=1 Tax=Clostridium tyrobutyricum TaxID=1519 RepID=UPI001C3809A2|nr:hypothetical protein [Clostridium tyrobutyricum]MBV4418526.1 hypothetical protein [Clostridium tyrobutyricum]
MYDFRYDKYEPEYTVPYIQFIPVPVFMPRQPGGIYGRPTGRPPQGGISGSGMPPGPPGPPPSKAPAKRPPKQGGHGQQAKSIDGSSLRPCRFKYVYIWPKRGPGFWAWLINVGRNSISGYRWYRGRWAYFGMDLKQIDSFLCY